VFTGHKALGYEFLPLTWCIKIWIAV